MPRPAVADFVDSFFTRILFQNDDELAASVLSTELADDAVININGNLLTASEFVALINTKFRVALSASISEIKDLNIVPSNEAGSTGIVGQWPAYVTKGKIYGKELKPSAITIVKVEERSGKNVVTAIWETQTIDES